MMRFNVFEKVAQLTEARREWLDEKSEEPFVSVKGSANKSFRDYEWNLEKYGLQFRHDCPWEFGMINQAYRDEFSGDIATTREFAALEMALTELDLVSDDDDDM